MKDSSLQGSDIFAIQTLYDGTWRCDRKFIAEKQAQEHANLLMGDWGRQRVRLLLGQYDAVCDHRRYNQIEILPPKTKRALLLESLVSIVITLNSKNRLVPTLGVIGAVIILLTVSAITSFPSMAGDKNNTASDHMVNQAQAPIVKNSRDVFVGLLKGKFSRLVTLKDVPLRLHGDWSELCASGIQDIQISKNFITEFEGAIATDRELQAVFQVGQTYGLVGETGVVQVVELTGIDHLKSIGHINLEGEFIASQSAMTLKRCL